MIVYDFTAGNEVPTFLFHLTVTDQKHLSLYCSSASQSCVTVARVHRRLALGTPRLVRGGPPPRLLLLPQGANVDCAARIRPARGR